MKKIVSCEWLAKEIDKQMGCPDREERGFWTSVEVRKARKGNEPNWRYSFNSGAVPAGFEKRWAEVRAEFESKFDVDKDAAQLSGS